MRYWPILATLWIASPATAAPLWQKSESGMTIAQVKAAFPAAKVPYKVSTLGTGARCELAIEGYQIDSDSYQVCFYFTANSLRQVMLTADAPSEALFDAMNMLLRSKYGPELEANRPLCDDGILRRCEANWSLKTGTNVSILFMSVGGSNPLVNIVYQTRMASEASKL